jgi:hypothetical protein
MAEEKITLETVRKWIDEKFSEDDVISRLDEEIMNWVADDWEDECDSEYDWYMDYGRGEAEDVIRQEIYEDVLKEFGFTIEGYAEMLGEDVWDTVNEVHDCLNRE